METTEQAWRCPVCATLHETLPVKCTKCGRVSVREAAPPQTNEPSKIKTYAKVIGAVLLVNFIICGVIYLYSYQKYVNVAKQAEQKAWRDRIEKLYN
jgi:hypothetical protein